MKTKLALAFIVLAPSLAAAAGAPTPQLPRPLMVDASNLAAGAVDDATWSAWRVGDTGSSRPLALAPTSDARWLTTTVLESADSRGAWLLLGRAPGFAATLLVRNSEVPSAVTEIVTPRVDAAAQPGGFALSWSASTAAGLAGWRLERSENGSEWTSVAMQAADAVSATDAPPDGAWTWRLVPVLADGVDAGVSGTPSPVVRASDGDLDDDGIADTADRCRVFADPTQADADGDGVSNACEVVFADVAPRGAPDGVVGLADVIRLLRFAVGLDTPSPTEALVADIAPALVLTGSPDRATPRLLAPRSIGVDDAVLALRVSVGLTTLEAPR